MSTRRTTRSMASQSDAGRARSTLGVGPAPSVRSRRTRARTPAKDQGLSELPETEGRMNLAYGVEESRLEGDDDAGFGVAGAIDAALVEDEESVGRASPRVELSGRQAGSPSPLQERSPSGSLSWGGSVHRTPSIAGEETRTFGVESNLFPPADITNTPYRPASTSPSPARGHPATPPRGPRPSADKFKETLDFISLRLVVVVFLLINSYLLTSAAWNTFQHGGSFSEWSRPSIWQAPSAAFTRLESQVTRTIEKDLPALTSRVQRQESATKEIARLLPDKMAVTRGRDGKMEIPEDFWAALQERLDRNYDVLHQPPMTKGAVEDIASSLWQRWITANEHRILEETDQNLGRRMASSWRKFAEDNSILTKDEFMSLLNTRLDHMASDLIAKNLDADKLTALTETAHFMSRSVSHHKINWFNVNLGTLVDPFYTSATAGEEEKEEVKPNFWSRVANSLVPKEVSTPDAHGPYVALQPWDGFGDAWCTTAQGQLSILLAEYIYPESITMEHLPFAANPHPETTPKILDIWIEVEDPHRREQLKEQLEIHRDAENNYFSEKHRERAHREYEASHPESIPENFVRISRMEYTKAKDYIQHHEFEEDWTITNLGIVTKRVIVQIVENHGSPKASCIYRQRFHGKGIGETDPNSLPIGSVMQQDPAEQKMQWEKMQAKKNWWHRLTHRQNVPAYVDDDEILR